MDQVGSTEHGVAPLSASLNQDSIRTVREAPRREPEYETPSPPAPATEPRTRMSSPTELRQGAAEGSP